MKRLPKGETAMSTLSMLKFRASIFAAVLAVAPLSPTSHAQDAGVIGQVNVPFAFDSGSHHYQAGAYTIRMENEHTLLLRGAAGSGLAMTWMEDNSQPVKNGKAVFQKYGNHYSLSEISITGSSRHIYLRPSKAEAQMRVAGNKNAPTPVEIALNESR